MAGDNLTVWASDFDFLLVCFDFDSTVGGDSSISSLDVSGFFVFLWTRVRRFALRFFLVGVVLESSLSVLGFFSTGSSISSDSSVLSASSPFLPLPFLLSFNLAFFPFRLSLESSALAFPFFLADTGLFTLEYSLESLFSSFVLLFDLAFSFEFVAFFALFLDFD